ncbi:MAG: hypothetical protein JF600_15900 [Xanthomonadales bacterium]|nr:hypothetical protein [Xanthomonadales bacterium]
MTSTALPTGHWLRIVAHADFHDIPRCVLFIDRDFVFWLLTCPFDPSLDDYAGAFSLFRLGHDGRIAGERFRTGWPQQEAPHPDATFPIARVEFDDTRRERVFLHSRSP